MYYILLVTGLIPLISVIVSFITWLIVGGDILHTITSSIILFGFGFLLINLFFQFVHYGKARKQNNRHAINRGLFLIGLFLSNVVVDIVVYNYMQYATTTTTFEISNKSQGVIKKMFFTNGQEKYFIAPLDKGEKNSRALKFIFPGEVHYTFDLKGKTYRGLLLKEATASMGSQYRFSIFRNGRTKIQAHDNKKAKE